ncbi:MAG TPA: hypothetical protein VKE92_01260, partial [Anaerolineales bacterium]|nr:hypothetical protein [Anaerolineales bacterium]
MIKVDTMNEQSVLDEIGEDRQLLASTRNYILKLEQCSLCGRITTCERTPTGWQCESTGCAVNP